MSPWSIAINNLVTAPYVPEYPLRTCSICKESKSEDDFYIAGVHIDGSTRFRTDCKVCTTTSRKLRRLKNNKELK